MIRTSSLAWVIVLGGLCTGLFLIKQEVQGLEARLTHLNESILDDQQAIHVLRAEWSYLNQPSRLGDLARRLLHLEPRKGAGIISIEALAEKREAKPPLQYSLKPKFDSHSSPIVSPGLATQISATPKLDMSQPGDTGWVRANYTGTELAR